jgi:hypothetical protein
LRGSPAQFTVRSVAGLNQTTYSPSSREISSTITPAARSSHGEASGMISASFFQRGEMPGQRLGEELARFAHDERDVART